MKGGGSGEVPRGEGVACERRRPKEEHLGSEDPLSRRAVENLTENYPLFNIIPFGAVILHRINDCKAGYPMFSLDSFYS